MSTPDEYPFKGDMNAAIARADENGLDWVLDDQFNIYQLRSKTLFGSLRRKTLVSAGFEHRTTVDSEGSHIVLNVHTTRQHRLAHGVASKGFAIWFKSSNHGHIEQIVNALLRGGPLRDTGDKRPWPDRILDGQYFEVTGLQFTCLGSYDVERVDGDALDPAWITPTAGSFAPRDLPNSDLPRDCGDGWSEIDHEPISGRSIFKKPDGSKDMDFEVRERDGTVICRCSGSRGDVQYVDAWLFFVNASEGHRVRLDEPHKEGQQVLDLPLYTPAPPDFSRYDLANVIVPPCFVGDAQAAVIQVSKAGHHWVVDDALYPYRLRFGSERIHLVPPNERRGVAGKGHAKPFSMHALFHRDDDKINADLTGGVFLTFPATDTHAQRIEDITRWINTLRPGRAIRYKDDTVLQGKRFEVNAFYMLDANPWRHPCIDTSQVDPDGFVIF